MPIIGCKVSASDRVLAAIQRIISINEQCLRLLENLGEIRTAKPNTDSIAKDLQQKPESAGWLKTELLKPVKHLLGSTTFGKIRKLAGIEAAERGGNGQKRRYTVLELQRLIEAAPRSNVRTASQAAEVWSRMLPNRPSPESQPNANL